MNVIRLSQGGRLAPEQLPRQGVLPAHVMEAAQGIVDEIRSRKDEALRGFCLNFDGVEPASFAVGPAAMDEALERVDPAFLEALEKAARQIRDFHEREIAQSWFTTRADGTILGVKVTPVSSAGIYVPGGRAQYPSTVRMNAIPAKVAGVGRIVMVTPPQKEYLLPIRWRRRRSRASTKCMPSAVRRRSRRWRTGPNRFRAWRKDHRSRQLIRGRSQTHRVRRRGNRHGGGPERGMRARRPVRPTPRWSPPI